MAQLTDERVTINIEAAASQLVGLSAMFDEDFFVIEPKSHLLPLRVSETQSFQFFVLTFSNFSSAVFIFWSFYCRQKCLRKILRNEIQKVSGWIKFLFGKMGWGAKKTWSKIVLGRPHASS